MAEEERQGSTEQEPVGILRLSSEEVRDILPQREPFLFVNGPADVVPGVRVCAQATFARDLPFYAGHFPGFSLTPGVLIVEAMAQAASLIILTLPEYSRYIGYFVGMNEVRFHKAVFPGTTLVLQGILTGNRHGLVESKMEAFSGDVRVASAVLVSMFRPRRSPSDRQPQELR